MSITYNDNGTASIFANLIGDFVGDLQELFDKGYRVDLSKNDGYPFATVGRFQATLFKQERQIAKAEVKQPIKAKTKQAGENE